MEPFSTVYGKRANAPRTIESLRCTEHDKWLIDAIRPAALFEFRIIDYTAFKRMLIKPEHSSKREGEVFRLIIAVHFLIIEVKTYHYLIL